MLTKKELEQLAGGKRKRGQANKEAELTSLQKDWAKHYVSVLVRQLQNTDCPNIGIGDSEEFALVAESFLLHSIQRYHGFGGQSWAFAFNQCVKLVLFLDYVKTVDPEIIERLEAINWNERQQKAVALVRQAASLLDHPLREELGDPHPPDIEMEFKTWPMLLKSIASDIESSETYDITPPEFRLPAPEHMRIESKNIGRRGGAKKSKQGAINGFLVRELDKRIPANLDESCGRFAIIARLLQLVGLKITPQLTRSILLSSVGRSK